MERSFAEDVRQLAYGHGQTLRGEGILAITKALLQSGISYVGGYPGAPVSHLLDVLADANESILKPLGVYFDASGSEAAAAAMLGASINYPVRGAVNWKSIVGTNVASDALSHVASAGVIGGALIVIGEDYGQGAAILQERTHSYAMKSTVALIDPRNTLPDYARLVEEGFGLSEASNMPVFFSIRIRACHMWGEMVCKDNVAPKISMLSRLNSPSFDYARINLPPATYGQEVRKFAHRLPAARRYIRERGLNERIAGEDNEVGIILQGGLYNTVLRCLRLLDAADAHGRSQFPLLVLNVIHPLVPEEILEFVRGKRRVLVVEEGMPNYIEQQVKAIAQDMHLPTDFHGKDVFAEAGEYVPELVARGLKTFLALAASPVAPVAIVEDRYAALTSHLRHLPTVAGTPVPKRPPTFCTGCPERPVFSALKILGERAKAIGDTHISADIGCHSFMTLPPFNIGNSIMGYGMGLASSSAVAPLFGKRVISIMGDGGFWHNGLTNGVANAVFNRQDSVLILLENFYTAATGQQHNPSTGKNPRGEAVRMQIPEALRGLGVRWLRTVNPYRIGRTMKVLREALTTSDPGLKVVIARAECQLERQRRERPLAQERGAQGRRVEQSRFGVDPDLCTGDHSCMRLNGCPSLTLRSNPDPLRDEPIAHVEQTCVGCGVCGEVAHAAVLCPSFYQAQVIANPGVIERAIHAVRRAMIGPLIRTGGRPADPTVGGAVPRAGGKREAMEGPLLPSERPRGPAAHGMELGPISVLVSAIGGHGGGVLSDWIVEAATLAGYPVQSTSIPGVAQRTGSTTYYIEIARVRGSDAENPPPVFSLYPVAGDLDVLLATEFMEAGRAIEQGYVSPGKTMVVTSTHRVYSIYEKIIVGDGTHPNASLVRAVETMARDFIGLEAQRLAREHDTELNAVLLGALAATRVLPMPVEVFERAIAKRGLGVDRNLKGFRLGFEWAGNGRPAGDGTVVSGGGRDALPSAEMALLPGRGREAFGGMVGEMEARYPALLHDTVREALRRLIDYQGPAYAHRFLADLDRIRALDEKMQGGAANWRLTKLLAKHLAVWMTYEDAIRVADLKTRSARFERIRREVGARDGHLITVTDYLKPDLDEICGILPRALVGPVVQWARRRWPEGRPTLPQQVKTTSVLGFLRLWALARLRFLRPISHRCADEEDHIRVYLAAVEQAAALNYRLGCEVAETARIVKGYGEVRRRALRAFRQLLEEVIGPLITLKEPHAMDFPVACGLIAKCRDLHLRSPEDGKAVGVLTGEVVSRACAGDWGGARAVLGPGI